jgi:hypothetical protein
MLSAKPTHTCMLLSRSEDKVTKAKLPRNMARAGMIVEGGLYDKDPTNVL